MMMRRRRKTDRSMRRRRTTTAVRGEIGIVQIDTEIGIDADTTRSPCLSALGEIGIDADTASSSD
jgi:hypothetical protein